MQSKLIKQLSFILIFIIIVVILITTSEYMITLLASVTSPSPRSTAFYNVITFAIRCAVGVAIILSTKQFVNMLIHQSKTIEKNQKNIDKLKK